MISKKKHHKFWVEVWSGKNIVEPPYEKKIKKIRKEITKAIKNGLTVEEVRKMHEIIDNSGKDIRLIIDHNFLKPQELVEFLSHSDINLFLYDPHQTRSLSGSIDYALSARRPIGISRRLLNQYMKNIQTTIF